MEKITLHLIEANVFDFSVKAWSEDVLLPTYGWGMEEKNPVFLEKRVYQGSSGAVYPFPVIEKIHDDKTERLFHALFIENKYIKVMILPELGGRIHMAYDKIKKRHFVYYNQVIKPALVGLTGPWISGGIEFNWPQHHRPSTFLPLDFKIEEYSDGSKVVWCSELERMSHTKGMHGIRLYPDKAYIEIEVKIFNRNPFPQTFLWWANPAVVVHDDYHSVFPPDVHAVFDHGKRDVSSFPIATGTYYKVDYSAGIDISRYKNIPVPTSYMAIRSKYDFVGGYDEKAKAGLLHVANHHVSTGKKQWTWGNGDFGQAWDRNLTDEDGPYIELMTGVYTDNQPDFSWIHPYEEKSWKQYFMPYAEVGYVKNATKEAVINLEPLGNKVVIKIYVTSLQPDARIILQGNDAKILFEKTLHLVPEAPFCEEVFIRTENYSDLELTVYNNNQECLVTYKPETGEQKTIPEPAKAALLPNEIKSIEELYLTGLHLEQYRHATFQASDYYLEALHRDPDDVRNNNAMGLWFLRKGQFAKAEPYFRKAMATITAKNPNPYDSEPLYFLGICLKAIEKNSEAYDSLYKATWNAQWQDASYFTLAQIDCSQHRWVQALELVEKSLVRNWNNHKSRVLKTIILRKLNKGERALQWIDESLKIDPFNSLCLFEQWLITSENNSLTAFQKLPRGSVHNYLYFAFEYIQCGCFSEAMQLLNLYQQHKTHWYPMAGYTQAYCLLALQQYEKAKEWVDVAEKQPSDYCFPNRIDEVLVLKKITGFFPLSAKAWYYLGNYWYANRQYTDAIECWEKSEVLNPDFPTLLRNLAIAYYNKANKKEVALKKLEKAFDLDTTDARIFLELDQLRKRMGVKPSIRLQVLERYHSLVKERDDLYLEKGILLFQTGEYGKALEWILNHKFHPWEGGEGKVTRLYTMCNLELAKIEIQNKNFENALKWLIATDKFPGNLGEGKLSGSTENDIHYYKGIVYKHLEKPALAEFHFQKATQGSSEPRQAFFYNDQQPDAIYFQGLAWFELGKTENAFSCFNKLISYGNEHLNDDCKMDYFAVSLPEMTIWDDDLNLRNKAYCQYMMALGYAGLGVTHTAKTQYQNALDFGDFDFLIKSHKIS